MATSAVTFFRSMGGAIGTALFGAILNTRLKHHLVEVVPSNAQAQLGNASQSLRDVTAIQTLPEPVKTWVLTAFTRSMDDVFLVAVPFMVVALIVALTMREKPRSDAVKPQPRDQPASLLIPTWSRWDIR